MTGDVGQTLPDRMNEVVRQGGVVDSIDSRVDRASWLEAQPKRRVGNHINENFEGATSVIEEIATPNRTHASDDSSLQQRQLSDLRRNIGRNSVGEGIKAQSGGEHVLQGSIVQITRHTRHEVGLATDHKSEVR